MSEVHTEDEANESQVIVKDVKRPHKDKEYKEGKAPLWKDWKKPAQDLTDDEMSEHEIRLGSGTFGFGVTAFLLLFCSVMAYFALPSLSIIAYVGVALSIILIIVSIVISLRLKSLFGEGAKRNSEFFEMLKNLEDAPELDQLSARRFENRQAFTVRDILFAREIVALHEKYDRIAPSGYIQLGKTVLPHEKS